jgi:deoxyribose-phosphate aldolase
MVKLASNILKNSDVLVCTVVSFPHGDDMSYSKLEECRKVIIDGADEVDMVLNYTKLKYAEVEYDKIVQYLINDVYLLVDECHKRTNKEGNPVTLKVIVESGLLRPEETELATKICIEAGADFIKTSTGMVEVGAEISKLQIMKRTINAISSDMKIKASCGIRTMEDINNFDPLVDRFGIGFTAVDKIFGSGNNEENY